MAKLYEVKKLIWWTGDPPNYYYPARPGEDPVLVTMDHLSEERLARVLELGAVVEWKDPVSEKVQKKSEKASEVNE